MTQYYVLMLAPNTEYCAIYDMPNDIPNSHYAVDGISLNKTSHEYIFDMSTAEPGIMVADIINNALGYTMVSSGMKEMLEENSSSDIEFTPFKLKNHKKRIVDDDFYIANVIGTLDWVDPKKTEGTEDPVNPGRYMMVTKLVFDNDKVDENVDLFRLAIRPRYLVVREDLKEKLEKSGMTGFGFQRVGSDVTLW